MSNQAVNVLSQEGMMLTSSEELLARHPMRQLVQHGGNRRIGKLSDLETPVDFRFNIPSNKLVRWPQSFFRCKFKVGRTVAGKFEPIQRARMVLSKEDGSGDTAGSLVDIGNAKLEFEEEEVKEDNPDKYVWPYALAPNVVAQLIQQIRITIGDREITTMKDVGLIDTFLRRMNGTLPKNDYTFWSRHAQISQRSIPAPTGVPLRYSKAFLGFKREEASRGYDQGSSQFTRFWIPNQSIFTEPCMAPGLYSIEVTFQPQDKLKACILQSLIGEQKPSVVLGELEVDVTDFSLFTMQEDRLQDVPSSVFYDISEAHVTSIATHGAGPTTVTCNLRPNTQFLGVALGANSQITYNSQTDGPGILRYTGGSVYGSEPDVEANDLRVKGLQVRHGGKLYPQKPFAFDSKAYSDGMQELYAHSSAIVHMGSDGRYRESYGEFMEMGPYFLSQVQQAKGETQADIDIELQTLDHEGNAIPGLAQGAPGYIDPRVIVVQVGRKVVECEYRDNELQRTRIKEL